jgi:hypothetical protein
MSVYSLKEAAEKRKCSENDILRAAMDGHIRICVVLDRAYWFIAEGCRYPNYRGGIVTIFPNQLFNFLPEKNVAEISIFLDAGEKIDEDKDTIDICLGVPIKSEKDFTPCPITISRNSLLISVGDLENFMEKERESQEVAQGSNKTADQSPPKKGEIPGSDKQTGNTDIGPKERKTWLIIICLMAEELGKICPVKFRSGNHLNYSAFERMLKEQATKKDLPDYGLSAKTFKKIIDEGGEKYFNI